MKFIINRIKAKWNLPGYKWKVIIVGVPWVLLAIVSMPPSKPVDPPRDYAGSYEVLSEGYQYGKTYMPKVLSTAYLTNYSISTTDTKDGETFSAEGTFFIDPKNTDNEVTFSVQMSGDKGDKYTDTFTYNKSEDKLTRHGTHGFRDTVFIKKKQRR